MSNPQRPQDGTGILMEIPDQGIMTAWAPSALFSAKPTDGTAGFCPGCQFYVTNTPTGSPLYVNEGTLASCKFVADPMGSEIAEVVTTISTVGTGTLTAAGIAGGVISRTGAQTAAFTDTTDTAALIIAALGSPAIGTSWEVTIQNTTAWDETLANGSGVTVSGQTVIGAGMFARYLVTYSAAATVTMACIGYGPINTSNVGKMVLNVGNSAVSNAAPPVLGLTPDLTGAASGTTQSTFYALASVTLPANALSANGKGFFFSFSGVTASNANAKDFRLNLGASSTTTLTTGNTGNAQVIVCSGWVFRTGVGTQRVVAELVIGTASPIPINTTATADETTALAVSIQSQNTAAAAASATGNSLILQMQN